MFMHHRDRHRTSRRSVKSALVAGAIVMFGLAAHGLTSASENPPPPTSTLPDTTDPSATPDTTDPSTTPDTTDPSTTPDTTDPSTTPDTTEPCSEPTAPKSLMATAIASDAVKVTWSPPTTVGDCGILLGYEVAVTSPGYSSGYIFVAGTSKTFVLPPGRTYQFRARVSLKVEGGTNAGPWSNTVSVTLPATVPSAPQALVATGWPLAVNLTWGAPASNGGAAIDKYLVQRATSAAGPWTPAITTSTSFTIAGLTNGTKYYFRVYAHNSAGWSLASAMVSATPHF